MANGYLKSLLKKLKLNESTISMFLGFLVVIVIGMLVFNYFKSVNLPTEEEKKEKEEVSLPETTEIKLSELPSVYTVKEDDNLWKIAENLYGSGYNWVDIVAENKLANPDGLAVGQELNIPKAKAKKPITDQSDKSAGGTTTDSQYTVVKGDHLWAIAVKTYGDGYRWVEIARENNLTNPDLIHPGNILTLPR